MTTTETTQVECCPICLRTSRDGRPHFACETTRPNHTPMFEQPDREMEQSKRDGLVAHLRR